MAYQQGFKSPKSSKTDMESSTTMPIGLQEWIMMITKAWKMMMDNTTTTKTTKLRTNSNNKNKSRNNSNNLILMRSTTSSKMQDKTSIQTYMKETITPLGNNCWITQQSNTKQSKGRQEGWLKKPDRLNGWNLQWVASRTSNKRRK